MSIYARIENENVVEIINIGDDQDITAIFHPDFVTTCEICDGDVKVGWAWDGSKFSGPAPASFASIKEGKAAEIDGKINQIILAGAPASGDLHIALDDSSRADMGSMATTALAAISGAVSWPDSYKEGWISIENTRIPLATPQEGLMLAAGVGDYYAKVRQNGRTMKDATSAAKKQSDLDGIDVNGGWPA